MMQTKVVYSLSEEPLLPIFMTNRVKIMVKIIEDKLDDVMEARIQELESNMQRVLQLLLEIKQ